MDTIDLDALSAARREETKERPTVKYQGITFEMPVEMPFAVVEAVGRMQSAGDVDNGQVAGAIADLSRALFGSRYREFLDLGPSVADITALLDALAPMYAVSPGESPASE